MNTQSGIRVRWSGPIDLYLRGHKGLAAARAVVDSGTDNVGRAVVAQDDGLTNDPADEITDVLTRSGIRVGGEHHHEVRGCAALAVGWPKLIHAEYERIFVVHDSLLPHLRGWNPLVTALIEGDSHIGATLFLADGGMDTGPIISRVSIPVRHPTTLVKALSKICDGIYSLVLDCLQRLVTTGVFAEPQEERSATYSLWRDERDYFIDWESDALRIQRQILAMGFPYRGARAFLSDRPVQVRNGEPWPTDISIPDRTPGKIFLIDDGRPLVVCGKGLILLTDLGDMHGASILPLAKLRQRFS